MSPRLAATAAAVALLGCGPSAAEKREAHRVSTAISLLRNAAHDSKAAPLEALRNEPCRAEPVCAAREICVEAYGTFVRARAATAAERVDQAQTLLDRARRLGDECLAAQGKMKTRYRL